MRDCLALSVSISVGDYLDYFEVGRVWTALFPGQGVLEYIGAEKAS